MTVSWKAIADSAAVALGIVVAPVLRLLATQRMALPRFQKLADRSGFQLRSVHYYEPTYRETDLPKDTTGERSLPGIDLREEAQLALLKSLTFADELRLIPMDKPSKAEFGYRNNMFGPGDAEVYYSMIRSRKPRRILEIGSGNSTLMALLAIAANRSEDPAYDCEVTCIEPYEVAWLESTGVAVVRERVETVALDRFAGLAENDILFIDSSHVIRPFGDVLREFQEIVPSLAPGVLIHVHDIFTPRDYPELWLRSQRRLWNEQYLLEAFLAFNDRFHIVCANNWLKHNHWEAFHAACPMMTPEQEPGGFWIQVAL